MSYIVPRDKPDRCMDCIFVDRITYDCMLMYEDSYSDFEAQYNHCPLVEVEPHGDLVDRGWVRDSINHSCWIEHNDYLEAIGIIDDAPTIIEAEGSEE